MPRKAQMFVVTMFFLIGLIFTVQALLFQYTALDLSAPFRQNSIYLLKNTEGLVNSTIRSTPECADFSVKMDGLKNFLEARVPSTGYVISLDPHLNCAYWPNSPPGQAPLNITINILGKGSETTTMLNMYHN